MSKIFRKKNNCVSKKIGEEYILIPVYQDADSGQSIFRMNETAAFIWDRIDGKNTLDEMVDMVVAQFDVSREIAQNDVSQFLNDMSAYIELQNNQKI